MDTYRAVNGIDFDGIGDEPGVRVEPGETLPPIAPDTAAWLLEAGAIERVPPVDHPKPKTRKVTE